MKKSGDMGSYWQYSQIDLCSLNVVLYLYFFVIFATVVFCWYHGKGQKAADGLKKVEAFELPVRVSCLNLDMCSKTVVDRDCAKLELRSSSLNSYHMTSLLFSG